MRGVSRLWSTWKALIHALAFRLQEDRSYCIGSTRCQKTPGMLCGVTRLGTNPMNMVLHARSWITASSTFHSSQCIEFLTRQAVPEGWHLNSIYHHRDTGGKELCIDPTSSQAAFMNTSILIVYTATQSYVIEH